MPAVGGRGGRHTRNPRRGGAGAWSTGPPPATRPSSSSAPTRSVPPAWKRDFVASSRPGNRTSEVPPPPPAAVTTKTRSAPSHRQPRGFSCNCGASESATVSMGSPVTRAVLISKLGHAWLDTGNTCRNGVGSRIPAGRSNAKSFFSESPRKAKRGSRDTGSVLG